MAYDGKYPQVTSTLRNIERNGMISTTDKDEILLKVLKIIVQKGSMRETAQFLKQVRGDVAKVS